MHFIDTYAIFNSVMMFVKNFDSETNHENLAFAFEVILALSTTNVPEPEEFLNAVIMYAIEVDFNFSYIINLQVVSILGNIFNLLGKDDLFFEQDGIETVIMHYIEINNIDTMRIIAPICYRLILFCIMKSYEIPDFCNDVVSILEDIVCEHSGDIPDDFDYILLLYKKVLD